MKIKYLCCWTKLTKYSASAQSESAACTRSECVTTIQKSQKHIFLGLWGLVYFHIFVPYYILLTA